MMEWWLQLFPSSQTCWFCSSPVRAVPYQSVWKQICSACRDQIEPISSPICKGCGRARKLDEPLICSDCAQIEEEERVCNRSVVRYSAWAKQTLQVYKYRGQERLAIPLGNWMAEVARTHFRSNRFAAITFVPLHISRLQQRGFNQSERLAKEIGKRMSLPVVPLLERTRATPSQSQRGRLERLSALQDAFQLSQKELGSVIANQEILLVDDVYTTGTTLRECAKPLRQAGVTRVCTVTFAR